MRRLSFPVAAVVVTLVIAVSAGLSLSNETRYVAQLRQAVDRVEASSAEVSVLKKGDSTSISAAGQRLETAAGAACTAMRAYQNATTRYGTDEEYQLVQKLTDKLGRAVSTFGSVGGVKLAGPTKKQRSTAEQLLRQYARSEARDEVVRWLKDERLADILTSGDIKKIGKGLEQELVRRIDAAARSLSQRATGLALSLNAPLGVQVRSQAEQAALRWLSRVALRWNAAGLVVQMVGVPIIRFLRSELQQLFRDHKHVSKRTSRTIKGFSNRQAELQQLINTADSASLADAGRTLARAQRALDATVYLKSDLKKQGRNDLLAQLAQAEEALKAKISEARAAFLLDSPLARSDVRRTADSVCKLKGDVARINKKLGKAKPGAFVITGVKAPNPTANGPRLDLTVSWRGNPTFPVTMVVPPNSCRAGIDCTTPVHTFSKSANPLVFVGAIWCSGDPNVVAGPFDYSVYLEDAKHVRTPKAKVAFTCLKG
jgi:hypothetical protein